jgi:hypothetical protein
VVAGVARAVAKAVAKVVAKAMARAVTVIGGVGSGGCIGSWDGSGGMVQANVGQKRLKRNILRCFFHRSYAN